MTLKNTLQHLWDDYAAITPSAARIHRALQARGEVVLNDHIALRTFNLEPVGLEALAAPFLAMGYSQSGEYRFEAKKLRARSYSMPGQPRVFISELLLEELPGFVGDMARRLVAHAPLKSENYLLEPPLWFPVSREEYEKLLEVSEYAAWLSVFGLRANHFTVAVHALKTFGDAPLEALNAWLKREGFALNQSGGEIKGSPAVYLEQSSTLADRTPVHFANGQTSEVPSCYVEFALRHPDPSTGLLYDGFVTQSADKIFESTDQGAQR